MYKNKISAVYKIVNTVTGDFYVGSSKHVMKRWTRHRCPSTWKQHSHNPLYLGMQAYGVDNFRFQILAPVMPEHLKQVEQEFIDMLHPTYNNNRAKCWDSEEMKEAKRKYLNQLCSYNGEILTFNALYQRLRRAGIEHPNIEANKYLLAQQ